MWDQGLGAWLEQGHYLSAWRDAMFLWPAPIVAVALLGLILPVPRYDGSKDTLTASAAVPTSDVAPRFFHWWMAACAVYYLIGARELHFNWSNYHLMTPAVVALSAHAMVTSVRWVASLHPSWSERAGLGILAATFAAVAVITGLELRTLFRTMYRPFAQADYELGLALREVVPADDLIVTIATDVGDGTSIYYSGRYGWSYPPLEGATDEDFAWPPPDEARAVRFLDDLRMRRARWLGVVKLERKSLWDGHPLLASYVDEMYSLEYDTSRWSIYRLRSAT